VTKIWLHHCRRHSVSLVCW